MSTEKARPAVSVRSVRGNIKDGAPKGVRRVQSVPISMSARNVQIKVYDK